ncbi:MAG TPA: sigma-70 family RNA polymerase sigma factor [Gemmatales bacterium]|nr:sigma-70 family RNA polymerase sigma factor [Gemmatales bacterium]HMP58596.1 sigma-70 family RNA polymerase sigma factor [Gemmatales bacterium]
MMHLETAELVLRAQRGDRAAYGELVRRFEPTVYAVALDKLRDEDEARELAHEAFVRGMTKLAQLREPAAFVGWVRQIAVRLALNRLTRRPCLQAAEGALDAVTTSEPMPLERLEQAEARTAVRKHLDRLNPLDRDTLIAFYVQGRSIREIADAVDAPEGTIKRRLHVARARLRARLEAAERRTGRARPRRAAALTA